MFLKLDDILNESDYYVTDEEVIQAFRNLGYVTLEEANRKYLDDLVEVIRSKAIEFAPSKFELHYELKSYTTTTSKSSDTTSSFYANSIDIQKQVEKLDKQSSNLPEKNRTYVTNTMSTESKENSLVINTLKEMWVA
ncbi:hypothetical protein [Streptococcus salivarius]